MKKLFTVLAGILFCLTAQAQIEKCMEGAWADPDYGKEGINLEVLDDVYAGFFYTYEFSGNTGNQTWYVIVGDSITGNGVIVDVAQGTEYTVGDINLVPTANGLLFAYHFSLDLNNSNGGTPWCNSVLCADIRELTERVTTPAGSCPVG
jgi:hypothetical protein